VTGRRPGPAAALVLAPALVLALAAAGCATPGERSDAAGDAAAAFLRAVADGDGELACAGLAPTARQELESAEGTPCPRAVTRVPLPGEPAARHADVYGWQARVEVPGDTLFLARFDDGWRVTAAGCRQQPGERPYDCEIQGS
jgi:hypothetical protein